MPKSQLLNNKINKTRHSLAHLLATAVLKKYPDVKLGIGPVIENGFYYDFDFSKQELRLSPEDLPKIEEEMRALIKENLIFKKEKLTVVKAKKIFKEQPFKLEITKELQKNKKSINVYYTLAPLASKSYKLKVYPPTKIFSGGAKSLFVDLCKGPHIKSTKEINPDAFKITKIAGAYWRGDEKNPMLTRIYGIAFETKEELNNYLKQQEEAEKRDHRKLGAQLDLFSFHEEGPGLVFWHNKGLIVREELIKFWREEHKKAGYIEISTPIILNESLWHTSGHMKNYKENMYFTEIDERKFAVKPMNCPGGLLVYKERPHSYRELPMRIAELGLVHRHEMAGVLHGLMRVRAFTQDDAHIYCSQEQIVDELKKVIRLTQQIYHSFGFSYHLELSTRPKKFIGSIKIWNKAEATLKQVLQDLKLEFKVNPGDGAFYGPKIDSHIKDSIGRTWQCGTLQLDFAQPENFKLEYIDKNGKTQKPVMLHRTIYGSLERFIGILIEHFAGAFPVWLSPIQIAILPIGENHRIYASKILEQLNNADIRAEIDETNETLGKRIREAEMQKIPYIIIVGDKEVQSNNIAIRKRNKGDIGAESLSIFIQKLQNELQNKI